MGDAKKRGTFEQRQSESVAREQERVRGLPPRQRSSVKTSALMLAVAALAAGSMPYPLALKQKEPNK